MINRSKLYSYSDGSQFIGKSHEEIFTAISETNMWLEKETVSGIGSTINQTSKIIEKLPKIFNDYGIKTIFDLPCGDFNWFSQINLDKYTYLGGDIVDRLINENREKYQRKNIGFITFNLLKEIIPEFDLIFCRDCLVHFSIEDIQKSIKKIKGSKSKYLMTTTFPEEEKNIDIPTGGWRPINLELFPFNFGEPKYLLNEGCTEKDGIFRDKSLGLWEIVNIKI